MFSELRTVCLEELLSTTLTQQITVAILSNLGGRHFFS